VRTMNRTVAGSEDDGPPPYIGQCACGKFMVVPFITLVDSEDVAHNVNACQPW